MHSRVRIPYASPFFLCQDHRTEDGFCLNWSGFFYPCAACSLLPGKAGRAGSGKDRPFSTAGRALQKHLKGTAVSTGTGRIKKIKKERFRLAFPVWRVRIHKRLGETAEPELHIYLWRVGETVNSHAFHACIHGFESRTRQHFFCLISGDGSSRFFVSAAAVPVVDAKWNLCLDFLKEVPGFFLTFYSCFWKTKAVAV